MSSEDKQAEQDSLQEEASRRVVETRMAEQNGAGVVTLLLPDRPEDSDTVTMATGLRRSARPTSAAVNVNPDQVARLNEAAVRESARHGQKRGRVAPVRPAKRGRKRKQ
jgi:hypothetical protein